MTDHTARRLSHRRAIAILVFAFLAGLAMAWAGTMLRGPAFSDPAQLAVVPDGWAARPVEHAAAHGDVDLAVALGQQSFPVFEKLIADYARERGLKIAVSPGTCGISSGKLLRKAVDIGSFCCPPGRNDRLPGLEFHALGISPIALIVHPDNPVSDLSTLQAQQVYRGELLRWAELTSEPGALADRHIQPVARLHCKVRPGHWRLLLDNEDMFGTRLFEVGVIPDMISQVARNPQAIGYEVPLMMQTYRTSGEVKMLTVNGHAPGDTGAVLAGKYPLYRTYHLTVWNTDTRAAKRARELVAYLRQHIEKVHAEIGFIPVSRLQAAGWKFRGEQLVGEPDGPLAEIDHTYLK